MNCVYCGREMKKIKTSVSTSWGKYKIEIKGVEPYLCENCDRKVYEPEEARMIQELVRGYADSSIVEKPEILTVDEVSDLLKVSPQTIYNMVKDRRLPASKVGREWRFNRIEIEKILKPQEISMGDRGNSTSQKSTDEMSIAARGNFISQNDVDLMNSLLNE